MRTKIKYFLYYVHRKHWTDANPQFVKIASRGIESKSGSKQKPEERIPLHTYCPFALIEDYIAIRPKISKNSEQFFVFADNSPVKCIHMRKMLGKLLTTAGFNMKLYGTHSLRIGRAVDLQKMQISVETIKKLGRWKSNAVFLYLR